MHSVGMGAEIPLDPSTIERDVESGGRPKFYYGWVMLLLAMGLAIASSPGQTFGVSIFIEPMRLELGLTHGQMGLAFALLASRIVSLNGLPTP